ncbi:MAG: hypothetical protein O7D30_11840 [Rickettsia endosymbiont of Ixodes persulcatus]|nr:hypothetical protein [Rickettsia endosymbiont of Ixodes persulcatus]
MLIVNTDWKYVINAVAIVSGSLLAASLILEESEVELPGKIDCQNMRGLLFIKCCSATQKIEHDCKPETGAEREHIRR